MTTHNKPTPSSSSSSHTPTLCEECANPLHDGIWIATDGKRICWVCDEKLPDEEAQEQKRIVDTFLTDNG